MLSFIKVMVAMIAIIFTSIIIQIFPYALFAWFIYWLFF